MQSYWRTQARKYIKVIMAEAGDKTEKELRKEFREAFPWRGTSWPYKMWLEEVKYALNRHFRGPDSDIAREARGEKRKPPKPDAPGQRKAFDG